MLLFTEGFLFSFPFCPCVLLRVCCFFLDSLVIFPGCQLTWSSTSVHISSSTSAISSPSKEICPFFGLALPVSLSNGAPNHYHHTIFIVVSVTNPNTTTSRNS